MQRGDPAKRRAIQRAAARLFGAGQYHGTTIPTLARAAGVAEGTIYNYFESKEDLAFRTLADLSESLERDLAATVPRLADPFARLAYTAAFLLQAAEEDLETARYVLCVDHESYLGARAAGASSFRPSLTDIVAAAVDQGMTRAVPTDLLVALWLGVVRAAVEARARGTLLLPLPTVADQVAEAAAAAIRQSD